MKIKKLKLNLFILYNLLITLFAIYVLLEVFWIPKKYKNVTFKKTYIQKPENVFINENKYLDENISIEISFDRKYDTNIYIADIKLSDISLLKSAFAANVYGKNILAKTSITTSFNNGILGINGDYYGFRDDGIVIRNGVFYRNTKRNWEKPESLIIHNDGSFEIFNELNTTISENDTSVWQAYSFGPAIIKKNKIIKNYNLQIHNINNPRTAIGIIEPLHYLFVCCDGRQEQSIGLTLEELANYMLELNCETAYNFDGGGSTTMFFNGKVINSPSDGEERPVSDIVYIGY